MPDSSLLPTHPGPGVCSLSIKVERMEIGWVLYTDAGIKGGLLQMGFEQ